LYFQVGEIPSAEHQIGTLREENPCSRVGTLSRKKSHHGGFDSHRLIKKGPVGKSVLPSLSGENPISERTDSEWEKSQQRSSSEWENLSMKRLDTFLRVGKIPSAEDRQFATEWRKSHHQGIVWMGFGVRINTFTWGYIPSRSVQTRFSEWKKSHNRDIVWMDVGVCVNIFTQGYLV